jgi:uncharacterized protein YbdZ (MbtH family)
MAIGLIIDTPGGTQAQYDQVHNEVAPDNRRTTGLLYHAAGPIPGGWRVVEIWDSREALDRFFEEKLGAALQRANISVQPDFFEVVNTM